MAALTTIRDYRSLRNHARLTRNASVNLLTNYRVVFDNRVVRCWLFESWLFQSARASRVSLSRISDDWKVLAKRYRSV